MHKYMNRIIDALDLETFVVCRDEEEGMDIMRGMMGEMGLQDIDIVYCQHRGPGARIRARAYVHRSGDKYGWLGEAGQSG